MIMSEVVYVLMWAAWLALCGWALWIVVIRGPRNPK
jgi:hypothetical protein